MNKTFKLHFVRNAETNEVELESKEIAYATTNAFLFFEQAGIPTDEMIVVKHDFDKAKNPDMQELLEKLVDNGIAFNGKTYYLTGAGASGMRKAETGWMTKEAAVKLLNWWHCGLNLKGMEPNKRAKYDWLSMSSVYLWEEKMSIPQPSIFKTAVFKSAKDHVSEGQYDEVITGSTNVVARKNMGVETNFTDGPAVYIFDDMKMSNEERSEFDATHEGASFRYPGSKGAFTIIRKSAMIALFEKNGWSFMVKDKWDNAIDIRDLQFIMFDTVFKWVKQIKTHEEWVMFQKKSYELGHKFTIAVEAHGNKVDMPYQQFQTLVFGGKANLQNIIDSAIENLADSNTCEGAAKLISGNAGKAAVMMPELLKHYYFAENAQLGYASKRRKMAGGRIPRIGYMPFAYPDVVAVLESIVGTDINGVIAAKHVSCTHFHVENGLLDITRCPHLDHAHAIRKNNIAFRNDLMMSGLFIGHTCFFSVHDQSMPLFQMDYDGDHVLVSDNDDIINAAIDGYAQHNNRTLTYNAMDAGEQKKEVKYNNYRDGFHALVKGMKAAPVGLFACALTKLWNNGSEFVNHNVWSNNIAFLTRRANTCIDAASHGEDKEGIAENIVKKLSKVKMPKFYGFAKGSIANDNMTVVTPMAEDKYAFYADSCVEQYSAAITERFTEELVIEDLPEVEWDNKNTMYLRMTNNNFGTYTIPGLCNANNGFFNDLARRTADDWNACSNVQAQEEQRAELGSLLTSELLAFAENEKHQIKDNEGNTRPATLEEIVNSIIRHLYCHQTTTAHGAEQLHRTLWLAFGDMIVKNIANNIGIDMIDVPDIDDLDDVDEFGFED